MIFALGDDVTLSVYDDIAHVRRVLHAIDIKNGFYRFFDDRGRPLSATFRSPPVARRNLFRAPPARETMQEFDLIALRDGLRPDLLACLSHDIVLNTRPRFSSVEQLRNYLT